MEKILSWFGQPLFPDSFFRVWMAVAVGVALVILLAVALAAVARKRQERREPVEETPEEPVTLRPQPLPVLELSNLQGVGSREEQQDAFGISRVNRYEEDGLLMVLCDGMGGMAEGGKIAAETVGDLLGGFPWENGDSAVLTWVQRRSARVYQQFRGHGGTTLVAALLRGEKLSFWCVGDSDLFLLRDGTLYNLNLRQEYRYDLVLRALDGAFPLEEAFSDPQASALSEYIGKENVESDHTRIPFLLEREDTLMLCSDGVSDTLTLRQIREAMALPPQACCDKLEEEILAAGKPGQDNYTAIALKYHGKNEEES